MGSGHAAKVAREVVGTALLHSNYPASQGQQPESCAELLPPQHAQQPWHAQACPARTALHRC